MKKVEVPSIPIPENKSLEQGIKDVIAQTMNDGTVDKIVKEQLTKGIESAIDDLFRWGDLKDVIKKQVKSVMIPYLENYDYSEYIVKLDSVLVDVLKSTSLENKKLLENFKDLMTTEEMPKTIKVTDLYEKWMKYVAEEVDTSDLEVCYDDGVSYEPVEVSFEVEYNAERDWSSFKHATITFECEKDKELNYQIGLSRWTSSSKKHWDISFDNAKDISSLRHLNEFEIYLMKLKQNFVQIEIDKEYESDEVTPEKEPEPTYS